MRFVGSAPTSASKLHRKSSRCRCSVGRSSVNSLTARTRSFSRESWPAHTNAEYLVQSRNTPRGRTVCWLPRSSRHTHPVRTASTNKKQTNKALVQVELILADWCRRPLHVIAAADSNVGNARWSRLQSLLPPPHGDSTFDYSQRMFRREGPPLPQNMPILLHF
jgi:hypothetical protein